MMENGFLLISFSLSLSVHVIKSRQSVLPRSNASGHQTSADMRAQRDHNKPKPKSYEYVTLNRFHLPDDHEFIDDLENLEKDNNIPFSLLTDICVPVSLLFIIVILGYEMDSMGTDADSTLVLVYGIVLIVATGGACGYVALRMSATQPYRPTSIFPGEVKLLSPQKSRSQRYYYQTIPEVHKIGKKRTITFMI